MGGSKPDHSSKRPGTHVLAEAALLKQPFLIDHPQEHSLVPKEFAKLLGSSSFAVVPLVPHQETLGVLLVDNRYNNAPITDNDMALLTRLTTHIGWVIENSRLFNKLLKSNQELWSTKEQVIQSEKLTLCFEDSGGGISQKTFKNIFHPFFTTKATGTGLGLSISRKIVESHGGTLQLKNNLNQGVTVYLYLPLQNPANYNKN